jgi:hypothetical protein
MSTAKRDTVLASIGAVLLIVAFVEFSTEVGKALGFIGLMLIIIAGLSQIAGRGGSGPPSFGGPGPPHHH